MTTKILQVTSIILFCSSMVFFGCSRQETTSEVADNAEMSVKRDLGTTPDSTNGPLSVSIVPVSPTVEDELQGRVSGAQRIDTWTWYRNDEIISDVSTSLLPAHSATRGDAITLAVTAGSEEAEHTVVVGNALPRVVKIGLETNQVFRGKDIVLLPEGMDPDGDDVKFRYEWFLNGELLSFQTESELPGDVFKKGDQISVKVIPYDEIEEGLPMSPEPFTIPNGAPFFKSKPMQEFSGFEYRYQVIAEDPDEDNLVFSLDEGPDGMVIDSNSGLLSWDLPGQSFGDYPVTISVTDSEGLWSRQMFTIVVVEQKK